MYFGKGFMISNTQITSSGDDKTLQIIRNIEEKHKEFTGATDYISPLRANNYHVKLANNAKFFLNNKPCNAVDLHTRDVLFEFYLRKYDFINDLGRRITGVSIVITKIKDCAI
jgi:hypothetical protein